MTKMAAGEASGIEKRRSWSRFPSGFGIGVAWHGQAFWFGAMVHVDMGATGRVALIRPWYFALLLSFHPSGAEHLHARSRHSSV